jgi:probable phosphoglycerate mutase
VSSVRATQPPEPQKPWTPPPGATELILARHGASADAIEGEPFEMLEGRGNPPLSPLGERQAELLAGRLASARFSRLYVTPLVRTQQTAAPLARATGLEPVVVADLVEVSLGQWSDGEYRLRVARGDPTVGRVHRQERWDLIPGAEAKEVFTERIHRGMRAVALQTGPDRAAVCVVHGGVIAEVLHQLLGCMPFAFVHVENASITRVVRLADGRWRVRCFNDTAHLAALSR